MSKATTQRLSERMATRTPPAPARGSPRPPQEHIQPLPYHDSTETQGSPLSPGDSKHGPRSRRPFQPPPNQGGRGGGGRSGKPSSHGGSGAEDNRPPLSERATAKRPGRAGQPRGRGGRRGAPRHTRRRRRRPSGHPPAPRGGGRASGPRQSPRGARALTQLLSPRPFRGAGAALP